MEQGKHTEDSRKGKHLTHDDRITIEAMTRGALFRHGSLPLLWEKVVAQLKENLFAVALYIKPAHIDNKEEFGHWKMDLVVGPRKGRGAALLTLVERKTRCLIVHRTPDKTQESVLHAMKLIEKEYGSINFRKIFKTITVDNGGEFLDADAMEKSTFSKQKTNSYLLCPSILIMGERF